MCIALAVFLGLNPGKPIHWVTGAPVVSCDNLTTENETYTLTADVTQEDRTSACFNVMANNVTLDCAGYSVILNGTGVLVDSVNDTTIKNCVFPPATIDTMESFSVNVTNASNVLITNSSGSCITLSQVNNATLTYLNMTDYNCKLVGVSQYAISLISTNNSIITDCMMSSEYGGEVLLGNNYSLRIDNQSYGNSIYNNYFTADWSIMDCYGGPQCGCLGGSDPNMYIYFENGSQINYFNTSRQNGTRIYSPGTEIGGNYYERRGCSAFGYPDVEGHSYLCVDADKDGFCDSSFELSGSAYVCMGTASCDFPNETSCTDGTFNPICGWLPTTCAGTCLACVDLSFDEGTCLSQAGCSWNGTGCEGTCQDCTTFSDATSCYAQLGCSWTGDPHVCLISPTCGDWSDQNCTCGDLETQEECQNQTGCSWEPSNGEIDYLPYSNKFSVITSVNLSSGTGCGTLSTPVYHGTNLTCVADVSGFENETIPYVYFSIYQNGTLFQSATIYNSSGDTMVCSGNLGAEAIKGDTWTCQALAYYAGGNETAMNSSSITVNNTAPHMTSPAINSSNKWGAFFNMSVLTCLNGTYSDADGDTINSTAYWNWWLNGTILLPFHSEMLNLTTADINVSDELNCSVIVNDTGYDMKPAPEAFSSSVTVEEFTGLVQDYPTGQTSANFTCFQPFMNNTPPNGQTTRIPILNVTNLADTMDHNITIALNGSLLQNFSIYAQTSYWRNPASIRLNMTGQIIIKHLTSGASIGVWMWGECDNVTDNKSMSFTFVWSWK